MQRIIEDGLNRQWNLERTVKLKEVEIAHIAEENKQQEETIRGLRSELDCLKEKLASFAEEFEKHQDAVNSLGECSEGALRHSFSEGEEAEEELIPDDTDSEVTYVPQREMESKDVGIQCELLSGKAASEEHPISLFSSSKTVLIVLVAIGLCACAFAKS
ncbi:hypothetical protein QR680_013340 [Steinernema hermaphroditum]|uniref:Uncharacterized protein n=1 Tax=Steinernema hermaphroditum TaxID=289476 RepID=A0AA39I568_9BILA|nr:hypothetical protein QR680_013340 [Steinernema hermaphroditum]